MHSREYQSIEDPAFRTDGSLSLAKDPTSSTARRILQEVQSELAGRKVFEKSVLHSKKSSSTKQKAVITNASKEV